jgi:catecholate siderophore receptor
MRFSFNFIDRPWLLPLRLIPNNMPQEHTLRLLSCCHRRAPFIPWGGKVLLFVALPILVTGFAHGQKADHASLYHEADVFDLEDFVVSGSYLYSSEVNALKTPTPVLNVPQSLSIVTADQISRQGFTSIGDLIQYTPGVNSSQGEGHRDAVVFRGVRSTADFFVDGVRDDVQYYRPLYNVEQVEILRGPNALLFGRGGTGGILNRVMKKADTSETFTGYQVGIDTFGATDVQLDGNYALRDNTAIRINLFHESLENHRDFYDGERFGINPTARFTWEGRTTLDLSYEYIDHERFIDRGIPTGTDSEPVDDFKKIVFGDPELNESTLQAHVVRASLQHSFSDRLKGNFTASYGDYDKTYTNFYASGYNAASTPDEVILDGYVDNTERENLILSANLISEFEVQGMNHTVLFGGEYIDTSSNQDRFNAYWNTTQDDNEVFTIARPLNLRNGIGVNASGLSTMNSFTTDRNDDTRSELEVFSLFMQDEIELFDQLQLVLGLRFDSFDIKVRDVENGTSGSQRDEAISPRLGIIYKPEDNISLYASYSETFLPQSGEQFDNLGTAGLDPDEFTNTEAGIKWDFSKDLSLTASVLLIEQKAPVVDDNDSSRTVDLESEISGFEIQFLGRLTDRWFISAGYSFLDGEIDDQNPAIDGNRPIELPEHMVSVWNSYRVTDDFGLGLGLVYQDESYINTSNSAKLPSYVRIDAAAYYSISDTLRIQINVENLTDELYYPYAHSTHQASVGVPISARLAIIGKF